MAGYIILGVTVAAFLTLGAYGLTRYLRGRDRYDWPTGQRTVGEYAGTRAHLVAPAGLDLGLPREDVAHLCAVAGACVEDVADVSIAEFCVHVLADLDYDRVYSPRSNGELHTLTTETGSHRMPLVACRLSAWPSTLRSGSLVVHELTHYAQERAGERRDYGHVDPGWWMPASASVEARARRLFMELRGRVSE